MNKTFEDYLEEIWMEEAGYMFLDDDLSEEFDKWVNGLDIGELMEYGEQILKKVQDKKKL